jgi:PEGA domain-containing protein
MFCVRLGVGVTLGVALATAAWAQERPAMEFAPEEVSRPDAGVAPPSTEAPPPQDEDREAAPISRDAKKASAAAPTTPNPAAVTAPAPKPAPPPAPKPEKPKQRRAQKSSPPPADPPPPAVPPRVTLHVWEPEKATRFDPEEVIEGAMGEVLTADARLRFAPMASLLIPPDAAQKALDEADRALNDAKQAAAEMDLDKAKPLLETALKAYQKWLPQLAARVGGTAPMRDGFIELAKLRFFEGNQDGAKDALRYVFVLDGSVRFNKALFPPQMKKLVVEARLLYDTLGTGRLSIDSDPPGAVVWLDGLKLPDRTPTQPVDAPNGPNFISYARRGYAPMTQAFEVNGGGDEAHPLASLSRHPNNPLAPIDRARTAIEESPTPPSLKEACGRLGVDMLVVVRTSRPGEKDDEQPEIVTAYLYDARPARVINRLEMKVEGDLPATARVMARELFHGVRLDGVWAPPKAPEKPKWHQRLWVEMKDDWGKFRTWKGFWYVVGGVAGAAVIGTVVGAAVYGTQRNVASDIVLLGGH